MNFERITLEHREQALSCIEACGCFSCDSSFVNMYIWQNAYKTEISFENGFLFRRGAGQDSFKYRFPIGGGDASDALAALLRDAARSGRIPEFIGLTEEQCRAVEKAFPDINYTFEEKPEWADYIYRAADLSGLAGKKYHSKRNFINRFWQEYGSRAQVFDIVESDFPEILVFNKSWCEQNGCINDNDLSREPCVIKTALAAWRELSLSGILLRIDGAVKAFTFSSRLIPGVADVHIEKADAAVPGAYAVINNELACRLVADYEFLNREEDMGKPGLRKSKQSYRPVIHLMRYNATPI